MKLIIDIPDWALERHIRVFAGTELFLYKPTDSNIVYTKTARCNLCGWCCTDIKDKPWPFGVDDEGDCKYLDKRNKNEMLCKLGVARPFGCCFTDPVRDHAVPNAELVCSIRWSKNQIQI